MHFDPSRIQKKQGGYGIARAHALTDTTLMAFASDYRTNISRKYVQLSAREIPQRFTGDGNVLVSTKYDGEGVFLYFNADEEGPSFLFNAPSGRVRIGLPCLDSAGKQLEAAGVKKALIVGELYHQGANGKARATVADVIHVSFSGTGDELNKLAFAAFDLIMVDGQDWRKKATDFEATWRRLGEILGKDTRQLAHRVSGEIVSEKEIGATFEQAEKSGEEGVVVRRLNRPDICKIKPVVSVDAVVIGYVEGQLENQYGVTSLLVGLSGKDGVIREFGRVGSGFSDEERVRLLGELSSEKIDAPVTRTDSDGRPVASIKPRIIVEVVGENLESENLSGRENLTQTFTWKNGQYTFHGLHPTPRLVHATFSRFRDDKTFEEGGARISQVVSEQDMNEFKPGESRGGKAKIIRREVYTKVTKGQTALRKFVLVETDGINRYPYVLVHTDVSLGRKDPLKHVLKVCKQKEQAEQLFEALLAENIKKGWEKDSGK